MEKAEQFILKNVKQPSIMVGWSIGWLVGWLVGLVGWVGWLIGYCCLHHI